MTLRTQVEKGEHRQASMQNTADTRQTEVAAHSLHGLGVKLNQLTEQYKFNQGEC